jgi:acetyl esterase/lipase
MIGDAYRALELVATHPRIDPGWIAVMGFSKGGIVALYSALTRFQRLHGPAGARFAHHIAFHRLIQEAGPDNVVWAANDTFPALGQCSFPTCRHLYARRRIRA